MAEYREPFKAYDKKIDELQKFLTETKASEQVAQNNLEEKDRAFTKLRDEHNELKKSIAGDAKSRQKEQDEIQAKQEEFENQVRQLEQKLEQATTSFETQK